MALQRPDSPAWHPRGMLVSAKVGRSLRLGTWAGALASFVVVLLIGSVAHDTGIVLAPVAAALGALAGVAVAYLVVPRRARHAFEAFAWLGRRELDRLREQTGPGFSATPDGAARWLEDFPPSRVTAIPRLELLAVLGRFDEATAEAARLPAPRDDFEAVHGALNRYLVAFVADRPRDTHELDDLGGRLDPASPAGLELRVGRAVAEARERLAAGREDWDEPLLAVRPALGTEPARVLARDVWWKLGLALFGIGLAVAVGTILLGTP